MRKNNILFGGVEFTPLEFNVLSWLVEGLSNDKIAVVTSHSAKTIEQTLHTIYGKLGVTKRTQATKWFNDFRLTEQLIEIYTQQISRIHQIIIEGNAPLAVTHIDSIDGQLQNRI